MAHAVRGVRRLIETDEMPIGRISEHARKDQNIRKGHLHALHVWWATRPLAACRAVLMATLLPDPGDENCPESFRRAAREALRPFTGAGRDLCDRLTLRRVLLDFIANFADWENAHRPVFVEAARRLVAAAHPDGPPLVVDPFAGIGSIPFETLRIGADAFAGDLNPVAVLLNKVALEYLPRYGHRLAEAVRKWGAWVRERAIAELRPYYPLEPDLPAPRPDRFWVYVLKCRDGSFYIGQTNNIAQRLEEHFEGRVSWTKSRLPVELIHWEAFSAKESAVKREQDLKTGFGRKWLKREYQAGRLAARQAGGGEPLAYLWARTIRCEGPSCGAEVPLVGLLWLSRKEKHRVALRYRGVREPGGGGRVEFEIFEPGSEAEVQPPIVKRFAATCPVCGYTTPYARVREQVRAKRGGTCDARMIAVITLNRDGTRGFRLATEADVAAARRAAEELARLEAQHTGPLPLVPDEPLPPEGALGFRANLWGMETWGDLFYPRQALALCTFVRLVREAYAGVRQETGDAEFARAVATCLALAVSNMSQNITSQSQWLYNSGTVRSGLFGNALPMRPDFAESNPTVREFRGLDHFLDRVVVFIQHESGRSGETSVIHQSSATAIPLPDQSVSYVVTDPPYYDAVPYADLSDFCYVWLKRMLGEIHHHPFRWQLTPKGEECIMDPGPPRPGEPEKTRHFFESTMQRALAECRRVLQPDGVAVVLFAHKGTAGWEALLNALIQAGWKVTSSWPIETEDPRRMRAQNSAVLASSVFLVCRPRPQNAGVGEWRDVLSEMNRKVAAWLPKLEQEGIHGADAIFACIGPALEAYSRYKRVETPAGEAIPLGSQNGQRGYLSYVWEAVAREALRMIFPEAEPQGFEEDARVTALWLWTLLARANGAQAAEAAEEEEESEEAARTPKAKGWSLPYDDARLIIQALGADEARLRRPGGILEIKGNTARLLSVMERRRHLLGGSRAAAAENPPRRKRQGVLFEELDELSQSEAFALEPGRTLLDRLHQAMLLFAEGNTETLRRFLVDEGNGKDAQFWRLADALSRLYPAVSREKRLVDGPIARRKTWGL